MGLHFVKLLTVNPVLQHFDPDFVEMLSSIQIRDHDEGTSF